MDEVRRILGQDSNFGRDWSLSDVTQLLRGEASGGEGRAKRMLEKAATVDSLGGTSAGVLVAGVAMRATPERVGMCGVEDLAGKTETGGIAVGARGTDWLEGQTNQRLNDAIGQGDGAKNSQ